MGNWEHAARLTAAILGVVLVLVVAYVLGGGLATVGVGLALGIAIGIAIRRGAFGPPDNQPDS